jgi:hypothetical protein
MVDLTQFKKREIKEVRQGDPNWFLYDGMIAYPRAMLHVLPDCPAPYKHALEQALVGGHIKLVAHVQGKELTWQNLTG